MTDPSANSPIVRPGDIIGGKYRVERVIGQGGMGTVVRARHTLLEQDVAIKVLATELASDPQYAARFMREAQTAVTIKGEHVVRVLDVGTRENGAPFMVMEYLDGKDLAAIVETSGPLPVSDAIDHILQACEALAEAHVAGLTHRDIKPSNLFLTKRSDGSPLVKLLDFGIAKPSTTTTDSRLTATGAAMGSPSYMSPEQVRNAKNVDHRSDIWSLGASLHEILTGLPPFQAETFPALCAAIIADEPKPLREVRKDAPVDVERIIGKCLEKKPENRYADVAALAVALAPFGGSSSQISVERIAKIISPGAPRAPMDSISRVSISPASGPSTSAFAATAASTSVNLPESPAPPKRSPARFVVGGLVALAAVAGLLFALRDKPSDATHKGKHTATTELPAKQASTGAANTGPLIAPAGTAIATNEPAPTTTVAEPAPTTSVLAPVLSSLPGATARPLGSIHPASTKPNKKKTNYDPFADQH